VDEDASFYAVDARACDACLCSPSIVGGRSLQASRPERFMRYRSAARPPSTPPRSRGAGGGAAISAADRSVKPELLPPHWQSPRPGGGRHPAASTGPTRHNRYLVRVRAKTAHPCRRLSLRPRASGALRASSVTENLLSARQRPARAVEASPVLRVAERWRCLWGNGPAIRRRMR